MLTFPQSYGAAENNRRWTQWLHPTSTQPLIPCSQKAWWLQYYRCGYSKILHRLFSNFQTRTYLQNGPLPTFLKKSRYIIIKLLYGSNHRFTFRSKIYLVDTLHFHSTKGDHLSLIILHSLEIMTVTYSPQHPCLTHVYGPRRVHF